MRKLIDREAKLRARGLLDMLYSPDDLAEDLKIERKRVYYTLLPAGLPHQKDETGHVWIHGPEAARWILSLGQTGKKPLAEDEGYCMACRSVVKMAGKPTRVKTLRMTLLQWPCPKCGSKVNRGTKGLKGKRSK